MKFVKQLIKYSDTKKTFVKRVGSVQSDLANETLKDTYIFDFISLKEGIVWLAFRQHSA